MDKEMIEGQNEGYTKWMKGRKINIERMKQKGRMIERI